MTTISTPSSRTAPAPTSASALDAAVARVRDGARRFARLTLDERVELARSMQTGYLAIAQASVEAACAAKRIPPGTPTEGEEWTLGPWCVVRHLRLVQQSLLSLKHTGTTRLGSFGRTADGRTTAQVFPAGTIDGTLFNGVRVDVHFQADVTPERVDETRARFYRAPHDGRVALVLGGGNVNAIPSQDVITKMFNEGTVCVLKMNPVNAYLGPFLERAYAEPIRQGFLAIVYGGADEGAYLARHSGIDEVHVTGSDRTYDVLMWGPPGPEQEARRSERRPVLAKPLTAELGNVSPILVVPGEYTDRELRYQAEDVAASLTFNASFDCNAGKIVVTGAGWRQRDAFLAVLREALERTPPRVAYYPGARERWERFTAGRAGRAGGAGDDTLPWALITNLDPADRSEPLFREESFCPVMGHVEVGTSDPIEFLRSATDFANDRLWGTLSAGIVVSPRLLRDTAVAPEVERAIGRLRYGAVCVNAWAGYVFAFGTPPWGAHPSGTPEDIQSGCGWVHDTAMLERVEKAVLRHPITVTPKPAYFASHRTAHRLMARMTALEESSSWSRVPGVLAAAVRA